MLNPHSSVSSSRPAGLWGRAGGSKALSAAASWRTVQSKGQRAVPPLQAALVLAPNISVAAREQQLAARVAQAARSCGQRSGQRSPLAAYTVTRKGPEDRIDRANNCMRRGKRPHNGALNPERGSSSETPAHSTQ